MRIFLAGILVAGCTAASTEPEPQPPVMVKVVSNANTTSSEPIMTKVRVNESFDRGAAAKALVAVDLRSCATASGPTGGGHVTVVFTNDGSVSKAEVDDGPFPGTEVGGCIAGKFRAVTVPPFNGGEVRVGKSFRLDPGT